MIGIAFYCFIYTVLFLFRKLWVRWNVDGRENLPPRGKGIVIAVNHISYIDTLILGGTMPLSHRLTWIAKSEIFAHPILAWFFRQMLVIPIMRGQADRHAFAAAKTALEQGAVLAVFAEGHRSGDGGLIEGQGGAVRLAVRTNSQIIPVAIWGTENGLGGAFRRKPINVRIGKPYFPKLADATNQRQSWDQLTEEMMLRIAALLPEKYWGIYREQMKLAMPNLNFA